MPHPGHLIISFDCRFHMNTYVNGYIVSTVGEYFPCDGTREILATSRGVTLQGRGDERKADYMKKIGFEDLGFGRKYETMVFKAEESKDKCCPWTASSFEELYIKGYNDPGDAYAGHLNICEKYDKKSSAFDFPIARNESEMPDE
jgi:hypothetical protein